MDYDAEKASVPIEEPKMAGTSAKAAEFTSHSMSSDEVVYNNTVVKQDGGILSKLRYYEAELDRRLGVESQAIDRKLPHERQPVSWHDQLNMFFLWASGTMNLSCFATGFLGWEFGVNLGRTIPLIIVGSLLGASVTGFCATLGAPTGLRQISIARYSMGWYPNKIIAFLNTVTQLGWVSELLHGPCAGNSCYAKVELTLFILGCGRLYHRWSRPRGRVERSHFHRRRHRHPCRRQLRVQLLWSACHSCI